MVDAAVEKVFSMAPAPVTTEDVQKMVDAALQKALETPTLTAELIAEPALTPEAIQMLVTDAVAKAIEPVLQVRGVASQLDGTQAVQKAEQHYLHGIL